MKTPQVNPLAGMTPLGLPEPAAQHTPGPWDASSDGAEVWPVTGQMAHIELCRIVGPWDGSSYYPAGRALANARLIAAAPDLLAALEIIEEDLDNGGEVLGSDTVRLGVIRTAISKAKGGA